MTLSLPSFTRSLVRGLSLLGLLLGVSLLAQAQAIRYVKPAATGTGNGSSWANASGNLQTIITASDVGDQVWVAAGTYKPTTTTDRTISFAMKNGVAIYGGFAGSETSLSQRPAVNQATPSSTTLSGDIGTAGSIDDNSYHVIYNFTGLTTSAVLDGFVITGGRANGGGDPFDSGGGMFNQGNYYDCNPLIRNCVFLGNSAAQIGGAIYNSGSNYSDSSPVLTNCSFQGNSANFGGVIYNDGRSNGTSSPVLTNCSFQGNSAAFRGGAMYNYGTTNPTLANCVLFGNGGAATFSNQANSINVTYSLLETGVTNFTDAGNNLTTTVSPFVSATDARLNTCAPAINSGNNGVNTTATDLAGNPRIFSSGGTATPDRIDMGAYEYQANLLTVQYVKMGGAGTGSGDSWANASGDLQATIQASCENQQVWVAQGTYKPGPSTNTDRSLSFAMKNRVAIYGGFAATGNPSSLTARNPGSFTTVLSGDIGTAGNTADNSYHVINNPPGLTNSAVLDGFLITGGNANGSNSPDDSGGGMINNGNGAGNSCSPLIRNCLFLANRADNGGGAIHNAGYTNGNSNPSLINCAFQSNAANRGGAIYNDGSVGGNGNPSLTNCSFQSNSAACGGAMGNVAFQGTSRPVLTNCVVWGNGGASTFNNQQGAFITTSYSLFESSVTGYNPGTGNLTATISPFANTTTTLLRCGSAAIDAGDPATSSTTVGNIDLAGNARFFNGTGAPAGRIDMGAYEVQGATTIVITTPGVSTATLGVAFNQAFTTSGGTSPYSYSLVSGSLPSGLGLATSGVLSGTPTQAGSFTLTVLSRDAIGCTDVSAAYVLTVLPGCGAGLSGPTWTGCLSTDWNTAGNWASGTVPTATDDVVIPSAPANQPVLSTPATAKSVEVQSGASLSITAAGSLTINDSKSLDGNTMAFSNRGTVQNAGQLVLGNTAAIGQIGFWNRGIANNAGGQISIDRSTNFALLHLSGTFTNTGAITIGSTANAGIFGLRVEEGIVANNPGGAITINRTGYGVVNFATFVNASRLTIGNVALSAQDCINNLGAFTNTATGEIRADRAFGNGIWHAGGTFLNDGKILIGTVAFTGSGGMLIGGISFVNSAGAEIQIDRVNRGLTNLNNFTNAGQIRMGNNVALGERGILNGNEEGTVAAVFTNQAGGLIQIDRTAANQDGLTNNVMATFTNAGTVTVGTLGNIGGNGIANAGTFANSACATLTVVAPINNGNSLTNAGLFTVSTTRPHSNTGTLTNNGLISYPQGNPIPNVVNNDVIATPISSCSNTITPALQLGGNSSQFSVGTTWYTDPALTQSAGTYDRGSNMFTATNLAPGSRTTLYVAATDQANGCTKTVSVSVTLNATVTAGISPTNPTLTCASPTVSLTASGGSSYVWDDRSTNAVRTVSSSGTYSVTVSNGAGCSAVASVSVGQDQTAPVASLVSSGSLTCSVTSVTLTANPNGLIGATLAYQFSQGASQLGTTNQATVSSPGLYSVTVTSANGCTATASTRVASSTAVVRVTNPTVTTVTQGVAFSQSFTASGGANPYSYSLASGSLPTGLSLATTGVLGGTPTQSGSFTLTVLGRDATGCSGVSAPYGLTVSVPPSTIRYVRMGATGSGNSWADASGDLQSQINFTGAQQVWVAQGTYKPGGNANTDRTVSFTMKNGVSILGGFAATGVPTLAERNPTSFTTVFSGDIGTIGDNADNSYHVVFNPNGLAETAVLDGITITGGNANVRNAYSKESYGGGMSNERSSPTLTNCRFLTNSAISGGGMSNEGGSSPTLTNCSFVDNKAGDVGGGMYNYNYSSPKLINCSFLSNSTDYDAGGMFNGSSSGCTLTNCVLFGNEGANTFYIGQESSITITYSLLEAGVAGYTDGGNNLTTTISPFVSSTDARLNGCSPAINTGSNAANSTTTDLAGNPRFVNTTIDRGAYEFQGQPNLATTITQQPPSGSLVCQGSTVSIPLSVSGTGAFTYQLVNATGTPVGPSQSATPLTLANVQPAQSGSYSVIVTGACNSVTSTAFSLTVNAPPVATISASPSTTLTCAQTSLTLTAGGGTSYAFSGPGIVSQNGNQALVNAPGAYSVTVTNANGCVSTTSSTVTAETTLPTATISGSLTVTPRGTTLLTASGGTTQLWSTNETNSTISVTAGTYSVTVTNASGCSSSTSVTVSTVNAAPVATPNANQTATVGVSFAYTVAAFTDDTPNSLTYTASLTPANGLVFDPATRRISGTPSLSGVTTVTVTATDPGGLSATTGFTITVSPAPVVVAPLSLTLQATPTTLLTTGMATLSAFVTGGTSPIQYAFSGPGTITLNGNTALVSGLPAGVSTFTVVATDATRPTSQSASAVVSVTVTSPPPTDPGALTITSFSCFSTNGALSSVNFVVGYANGTFAPALPDLFINGVTITGQLGQSYTFPFDQNQSLLPIQDQDTRSTYFTWNFRQACAAPVTSPSPTAPVAPALPNQTATVGTPFNYGVPPFTGTAPISYSATGLPNGLSFDAGSRTISGTPTTVQTPTVTITATNVAGSSSGQFTLAVSASATQPPTPTGPATLTITSFSCLTTNSVLTGVNFVVGYTNGTFAPALPDLFLNGITITGKLGTQYSLSFDANQSTIAIQDQATRSTYFVWNYRQACTTTPQPTRLSAETALPLTLRVLGNPVGETLEVEVTGAQGGSLMLQLTDIQGLPIGQRTLERADALEHVRFTVSRQLAGVLLLRATTPTQTQTIRVLKGH